MLIDYPSRRLFFRRDACWVLHDCCGHVGACVAAATTYWTLKLSVAEAGRRAEAEIVESGNVAETESVVKRVQKPSVVTT